MPTQTDDTAVPESETETTPDDQPIVTAHKSDTERTVFTENGNKEGWISTDLTVGRWL